MCIRDSIFLVVLTCAATFAAIAAPAFLSLMPHSPELTDALKGAASAPSDVVPPLSLIHI